MLTVKFGEQTYTFDLQEQLTSLTGLESAEVEEFIGGWERFQSPAARTRSAIVLVWLGKRAAGEASTLEEIGSTTGFLFGDVFDIDGDDEAPEDPMTPPEHGRPLAEQSDSADSSGGSTASGDGLETSAAAGLQLSPASTD